MRGLKVISNGQRGIHVLTVLPSMFMGADFGGPVRLESEQSLYVFQLYSHVGNDVHVHGNGRTEAETLNFRQTITEAPDREDGCPCLLG